VLEYIRVCDRAFRMCVLFREGFHKRRKEREIGREEKMQEGTEMHTHQHTHRHKC
jgi:hypothetical protein